MRNRLTWLSLLVVVGFTTTLPIAGGQSMAGAGLAFAGSESEGLDGGAIGHERSSGGEVADAEDRESGGEGSENAGALGTGPVFNEMLPCNDPNGCEKKL